MIIILLIFGAVGIGVFLTVYLWLLYRPEEKRLEEFEKKYQEKKGEKEMKWINEKTVQGDPEDIKKYCIPKEEYDIPNVIRCKDCKHKDRVSDYCMFLKREVKREDFCSRGEKK